MIFEEYFFLFFHRSTQSITSVFHPIVAHMPNPNSTTINNDVNNNGLQKATVNITKRLGKYILFEFGNTLTSNDELPCQMKKVFCLKIEMVLRPSFYCVCILWNQSFIFSLDELVIFIMSMSYLWENNSIFHINCKRRKK